MSWTCGTCWQEFATWRSRELHMDALDHSTPEHECDRCSRFFNSRSAVVNHMSAKNHWFYECGICDKTWPTEELVKEHEVKQHFYCNDCNREFNTYNNIKMVSWTIHYPVPNFDLGYARIPFEIEELTKNTCQHLNSRVHRGININCPFCQNAYTSATGLAHHLEGGACPKAPFLNRDEVYKLVRTKDPGSLISKKLLGWNGSPKYEATYESWNGYAFECYLCHRKFSSLNSLNQHLSSPTHQQNLYHCPSRLFCGREFVSLAALMNHLESESCGYTRFENVQRASQNIMNPSRLISFN
ncbi:hypothetical protein F4813DRAFT_392880 [Daldinia decipiens]|uniref:uncharacterized protein n=1 Tax=Daldinia decipiens TaxID=326647 RepID=UPI0020C5A0BC|nr:uncharacterized protein F4813DRAFT_392880 [Daldinia decipiens]KAI1654374.1 hypothetical protein F4813DRAFT_392880 [Daldinia decipiens]